MLADEASGTARSGDLASGLHRPASWLLALIDFIADQLPVWRDRPDRPAATAETVLTSQFCAHLNSAARKEPGFDMVQFRPEEPDAVKQARKLDLVASPAGETIWIEDRPYADFDALVPIECKRLPTPTGAGRDKREYLRVAHGSTGGVQRFKAGLHGGAHVQGAMIGYVQTNDILYWADRIDRWVRGLVRAGITGWQIADRFSLDHHDPLARLAKLNSQHSRDNGLPDIALRHLWIEMS